MRVKSTEQTKAHVSSAEMADEFPNFFGLGSIEELDEHFLYDLDNEDENEFLVVVDLETVNATNQVDKGTIEKANKSKEVETNRYLKTYQMHQ